ncbi:MAG: hypothetical protein INQ03_01150 [Candidatus Heimdallarchaeota archaeon]|nr:hypothetical protein [Candidatus Heimdallarchaeota archaeon]
MTDEILYESLDEIDSDNILHQLKKLSAKFSNRNIGHKFIIIATLTFVYLTFSGGFYVIFGHWIVNDGCSPALFNFIASIQHQFVGEVIIIAITLILGSFGIFLFLYEKGTQWIKIIGFIILAGALIFMNYAYSCKTNLN